MSATPLETGAPLGSPIPMVLYPTLATLLLSGGAVATASFFLYLASTTRHSRQASQELLRGGAASVLLGLGTLFLLLWTGVYV